MPRAKQAPASSFRRDRSMQTVRDACQLQPNALSIKLSDQIEQLDELIAGEGDGSEFFEKTHITQGMQDLISEGIARLAGFFHYLDTQKVGNGTVASSFKPCLGQNPPPQKSPHKSERADSRC